jgi:hypothetical protein
MTFRTDDPANNVVIKGTCRTADKMPAALRTALAVCFMAGVIGVSAACASAAGTARIQQRDGSFKVYNDVRVRIQGQQRLLLTSSDGKGTLIVNKASCTAVGTLLRCLPYSVELDQSGRTVAIALQSGTVWLNLSGATHQLPYSSTRLPSHGVLMALDTKRGTQIALTGTLDEVTK